MEPAEIMFRVHQAARHTQWRRLYRLGRVPTPKFIHVHRLDSTPLPPLSGAGTEDAEQSMELRREADAYLEHRWFYFNLSGRPEPSINWHADPLRTAPAPRTYSFQIRHRDEAAVGNIKNIWEKSRHHHLTVLAAAYFVHGDERYAREVCRQVLDWIGQNPYLQGVNWSHPLEHGIRLIAWVWCERWLRGSIHYDSAFGPSSEFWRSVWLHQQFIAATYSRGSSANNHLIGEMAGLYISSLAWPIFPESERWTSLARQILEQQAGIQTFRSGLNREMAFSYHLFVLEFLVLTLIEAHRAGRRFAPPYQATVRKMAEAIWALTDFGGNLPRYGDGDEGRAIQSQPLTERRDRWLFGAAAALAGAQVPVSDRDTLGAVLLGIDLPDPVHVPPKSDLNAFADAGIYVLAANRGRPNECFVLADAGPHGFLAIAAHAHADALSFTLSCGGVPILVDPGTYAYHTEPQWRSYFRGTAAHNTAVVDDSDQSRQSGPFLWSTRAATTVTRAETGNDELVLSARHDGYRHLGITHSRTFRLTPTELTLTDAFTGTSRHRFSLHFHFAPECHVVQPGSNHIEASRDGKRVCLEFPPELTIELMHGAPRGGWYSPAFGRREASFSVEAHCRAAAPLTFTTILRIHHEG